MTPTFDFEKALAPSKAFTALSIAKTESLIALNTALLTKYSNLTLANVKSAMEIKDLEAAQAFFAKQGDVAKEVAETMMEDGKAVAKIGEEYTAEVQKLVTETSKEAVEATKEVAAKAAPAKKAPAKKAA